MKKFIALLFGAALILPFAIGCSQPSDSGTGEKPATDTGKKEEGKMTDSGTSTGTETKTESK